MRPSAPAGTTTLETVQGSLSFNDVQFQYPGQRGDAAGPVLRGVSFTAQRGEVVALTGVSGSGKSTIASLVRPFVRLLNPPYR